MGAYCALRLEVTTDVTSFLAQAGGLKRAKLGRQLAGSELTRTMVLSVRGADESSAVAATAALAKRLEGHPEVAWVQAGVAPGTDRAFYELYYPRRFLFLWDDPEEGADFFSESGQAAAAATLKARLGSFAGTLFKRTAPGDPWLGFQKQLERLRSASDGGLELLDGQFVADGEAILFLASKNSAFDSKSQAPLLDAIQAAFDALNTSGDLRLEQSGVNRVARDSERSIKADITRISVLSTLGIVFLFLALFRSPRFIALGLVPLGAGVVTATTTCLVFYGEVHGLTLAFGSSLIGVCIDYPSHVFNHHTLDDEATGSAIVRTWPGLLLGALTTIAGFVGLLFTSFPGIAQISLFGIAGVMGALCATRWISAPLLPGTRTATALQRGVAQRLESVVVGLRERWRLTLIVPLAALALCAAGLPSLTWLDDPKALYEQNPELHQEQLRVRQRVSRVDGARFVIALGESDEEALQTNDAVFRRLSAAQGEGILEGFRSLHSFLWSAKQQQRNWTRLQEHPNIADLTLTALEAQGFRTVAFKPFADALAGEQPEPLRLADLEASPLSSLVRSFRVRLENEVGVLTYLRGVNDGAALESALADLPNVVYLDQNKHLGEAYRGYRREVLRLTSAGLVAVFGLILLRYRRLRITLAAFLPALLAAGATLALLSLAGETLHLLHVTALLMVLSIGADYGIFLAESRRHASGLGATVLSILLACMTTVLAFGLLALSSAPVLRAIGGTIGVGVVFSVLLAPAAMALAGADSAPEDHS
jgi:predicted exporter